MADLFGGWYANLSTIAAATKQYASEQCKSWSLTQAARKTMRDVRETFNLRTSIAVAAILVVVSTGIHTASAALFDAKDYFKVFVDGNYIGTVSDLQTLLNRMNATQAQEHAITWVPIRLAAPGEIHDEAVWIAFENVIHTARSAVAIRVGSQNLAVVQDADTAQSVLDQVKHKLANPTSKLDSIDFDQPVKIQPVQVDESQVVSALSAVNILLEAVKPPKPYIVSRGDSLWTIASDHNLKVDDLKHLNPSLGSDSSLQIGQPLIVDRNPPLLTVRSIEETDQTVDIPSDTQYKDDADLDEGQIQVIQAGQPGQKQQHVRLTKENGKVIHTEVLSEQVLKEPVARIVARGTRPAALPYASGSWTWPTTTHFVSSPFGEWRGNEYHPGIDLAAPTGTPIFASNSGHVIFAGYDTGGYGNCVRIDHGNGIISIYGHMSQILTSVGANVAKGQQIGCIGMTGEATGPHLHYEVHVNGQVVNPDPYMH